MSRCVTRDPAAIASIRLKFLPATDSISPAPGTRSCGFLFNFVSSVILARILKHSVWRKRYVRAEGKNVDQKNKKNEEKKQERSARAVSPRESSKIRLASPSGREKGGCSRAKYREGEEQFSSLKKIFFFLLFALRLSTSHSSFAIDAQNEIRKKKKRELASVRIRPRCNEWNSRVQARDEGIRNESIRRLRAGHCWRIARVATLWYHFIVCEYYYYYCDEE